MTGATVESVWQHLKAQSRPRTAISYDAAKAAESLPPPSLVDPAGIVDATRAMPGSGLAGLFAALTVPAAGRRKSALQQLQELVLRSPASSQDTLDVAKAAVPLLADSAASCREQAALLIAAAFQASPGSVAEMVPYVLPVIHTKLRQQTQGPPEHCEEVRVALLGVLVQIMLAHPQGAFDNGDKVLDILDSALQDTCPEVNLAGCSILASMAQGHGQALTAVSKQLVAFVMPLLTHRMQKVRIAAIQAVRLLVPWGAHEIILNLTGFKDPNAIPAAEFYEPTVYVNYFGKLAMDSAIKVRAEFVGMIGFWLCVLRERQEHETRLLPYLIGALDDDAQQVAEAAWQQLLAAGKVYEQDNAAEVQDIMDYAPLDTSEQAAAIAWLHEGPGKRMLPACVAHRMGLGARLLVHRCLGVLMQALTGEMTGWQEAEAGKAAVMLQTCACLAEDTMQDHLPILLPALCKAVSFAKLRSYACQIAEITGAFVPAHDYLQWLLPMLCKPGASTDGLAAMLQILSSLLTGAGHRATHDKDCEAAVVAGLQAAGLTNSKSAVMAAHVESVINALACSPGSTAQT